MVFSGKERLNYLKVLIFIGRVAYSMAFIGSNIGT